LRGRVDFDALENDHQLENPGEVLLELIETRTASCCGEHDIIRIEDD
jgi:mannose-6-phosphate isomerase-like protein (cupin superfamily)